MERFHEILERKCLEIRARSPHFSQRALAKRLGLSSGALSEILQGKRKISAKTAERISARLNFSPSERKTAGLAATTTSRKNHALSSDAFHLISDWWHYAILNLTQTKDFRSEPAWIARRLGLPRAKVDQALTRLLRAGLLQADAKGKLSRTHARLTSPDGIRDLAVQKSHREHLELAGAAIDGVGVEARDFTSITFTLDPARLAVLRKMIRDFEDEFMDEAESVPGKEVYRLGMQLFPLSKTNQGEN